MPEYAFRSSTFIYPAFEGSSRMKRFGEHRIPGRLFIVEGIDGSGKSTQLMLLHQWLKAEGYGVVFSEWNSSPLVKDTTKRGKKKQLLTPATFSLIHATDFCRPHRAQHYSAAQGRRGGALRPLHLHGVCARREPGHGFGMDCASFTHSR